MTSHLGQPDFASMMARQVRFAWQGVTATEHRGTLKGKRELVPSGLSGSGLGNVLGQHATGPAITGPVESS